MFFMEGSGTIGHATEYLPTDNGKAHNLLQEYLDRSDPAQTYITIARQVRESPDYCGLRTNPKLPHESFIFLIKHFKNMPFNAAMIDRHNIYFMIVLSQSKEFKADVYETQSRRQDTIVAKTRNNMFVGKYGTNDIVIEKYVRSLTLDTLLGEHFLLCRSLTGQDRL